MAGLEATEVDGCFGAWTLDAGACFDTGRFSKRCCLTSFCEVPFGASSAPAGLSSFRLAVLSRVAAVAVEEKEVVEEVSVAGKGACE
jgi:hypothetical protein